MSNAYIVWDDEWILKNYDNYKNWKKMWNDYPHDVSYDTFRHHCTSSLGLRSKSSSFTKEQDQFLIDRYPTQGAVAIVDDFNAEFRTFKSADSLFKRAFRLGVHTEYGLKREWLNDKDEIGTIKEGEGGNLVIKTGTSKSGWVRFGRYVWEQFNPPLPKDYCIFFLDGDNHNCHIDNLVGVPRSWLGRISAYDWWANDKRFNEIALDSCELDAVVNGKQRMIIPNRKEQNNGN